MKLKINILKHFKQWILYGVINSFNYRFWKLGFKVDKKLCNHIWVDGQGNFGMKSKDIFRDKKHSLKTLNKLRDSVKNYKSNN